VTRPEAAAGAVADDVAARVAACPAVAGLADGPAATYLPGRKVIGVAVRHHVIAVSVIARWEPLPEVVRQVRAAVAQAAPGHVVDVDVADIAVVQTSDVGAGQERQP
jgi:hypothetical protein